MTIANLEAAGLLPVVRNASIGSTSSDVGICFAFDRGYLLPFKVMVYSMARTGTLLDLPVTVYSDDPAVFEDPVVKVVVDRARLIEGDRRDVLYGLARDTVERPARASWNKGTFLKWAVFEPSEFGAMLFLDVDMLCLGPLEPLLDLGEGDLLGSPQFQPTLVKGPAGPRPKEHVFANLTKMIGGNFRATTIGTVNLNSGVMLVRKPLLSDAFFKEIKAFAEAETKINEQRHITDFFKASKTFRMNLVSSRWNFHENYLRFVDDVEMFGFLREINILHYAGRTKPWVPSDSAKRLARSLWSTYYQAAAAHPEFLAAHEPIPVAVAH